MKYNVYNTDIYIYTYELYIYYIYIHLVNLEKNINKKYPEK